MMTNKMMSYGLGTLFLGAFLGVCALLFAVAAWPMGPTASGQPLAACTVTPASGQQPYPATMIPRFNQAARNTLPTPRPTYTPIARGIPTQYPGGTGVTTLPVSTAEPIPDTILKAMGWTEGGKAWKQFNAAYGSYGYTKVSSECDYGVMQVNQASMAGMNPDHIAGNYSYNIGAGTRWLIGKWNWMSTPDPYYRLIAPNNHTLAENWYYAVTAYNKWDSTNDPNASGFNAQRPPFDGTQNFGQYPYQERVWGFMAYPGTYNGQLWSPLRVPWVPRGIWGLGQPTDWHRPAEWTSRPTFYYLPDIRANSGNRNSYLITQNTQGSYSLAADVAFYNLYGAFNRWWLDPPWDTHAPPIRIDPRRIRILSVKDAFRRQDGGQDSFSGAGLVCAGQDVAVVVNSHGGSDGAPSYSYAGAVPQGNTLYLPSLHHQPSWQWYSEIVIQNAGPTAATFNLTFYTQGGAVERQLTGQTIPPAASLLYQTSSYCGSGYYGPAVVQVTSGGPLAAVVREWNTDGSGLDLAYHGLNSGATRLYLPSQHKDSWGWTSWVHVQNPTDSTVRVQMYYYQPGGGVPYIAPEKQINPHGCTYFWTGDYANLGNDYYGPAELVCTSGHNVVAICNEVNVAAGAAIKALSYSACTTGANRFALPAQAYEGDWNTWTFVQNPHDTAVNVKVHYWYLDESNNLHECTRTFQNVQGHGSVYVAASDCLSSGNKGSAWVKCTTGGLPVVAIVNQVGAKNKDQAMSYNGIPR